MLRCLQARKTPPGSPLRELHRPGQLYHSECHSNGHNRCDTHSDPANHEAVYHNSDDADPHPADH